MRKNLLALVMVLGGFTLFGQGSTTSAINGTIRDDDGQVLIGATIKAVHTPSGTVYGNITNSEGIYRIPNMRIGGPYEITISYVGYQEFKQEDVFLTLGQTFRLNTRLSESTTQLDEIIVSTSGLIDGNRTGQQTFIDEELINNTPTVSRSIADYARLNPLARIGEGDDGFTISIAGQNNRYNAIYIDGAINNDVFGLSGGGTNGGQTGVQPISIDAIEQFQIAVAPFDVRKSGFAGGSVNAVTRSGTNDLEGSAYYFVRNESLAGKTPTDLDVTERTKLVPFTAQTYGFRLGGPLIKNKAFFFVNAEIQRDENPQPFDLNVYDGEADVAQLNELSTYIQNRYNYDIGGFTNNIATLESEKFLLKFDWNINSKHKLTARHSYVKAENLEARGSDSDGIGFLNGSEFFVSTTNSSALELNSLIGNDMSNRLIIGTTIVRDDRDPFGNPFPAITLEDGSDDITVSLGAETFSTANLLNQDVFTLTNDLELYRGKHSFLVGVNLEYAKAGNLFIRDNYGNYQWNDGTIIDGTDTIFNATGIDRFLAGLPADEYDRSFSQKDNVVGDESQAIAEFEQLMTGIYFQDEIQINDRFKLTAGLRVDIPFWLTDQPINEDFNNRVIPLLETHHDLKGARTGSFIKSRPVFAPRVGFNYDLKGDRSSQLRGGVGIFTSRIPLVWPGGAYNNYGLNIGGVERSGIAFEPDVNSQPFRADLDNVVPSGQIDLFSEDFKLPQVLKLNMAFDKDLGKGYLLTLEGLYTKNIQAVRYESLNLLPLIDRFTGSPDDRPIYSGPSTRFFPDTVIAPEYTGIYLASNTSKGFSYNLAVTLNKRFESGFQGMLSYSYGDSYSVFDGTSSQNISQWRGYHPALEVDGYNGGRNGIGNPQRSTFSQGHRVLGQLSYGKSYLGFLRTSISLNFEARTGGYFSYVYGANNFRFTDDGGFDNNELIYIPNDASEINLVDLFDTDGVLIATASEQWEALDTFIKNDNHLNSQRGDYAKRNGGVLPMQFTGDFRFLQDFYLETGSGKRNTIQISLDIFNFTNLLNKDWGRRRFAGNFGNYSIVNLQNTSFSPVNPPEFTVDEDILNGDDPWENNVDDSGFRSSRWQMQLGVRYIFN